MLYFPGRNDCIIQRVLVLGQFGNAWLSWRFLNHPACISGIFFWKSKLLFFIPWFVWKYWVAAQIQDFINPLCSIMPAYHTRSLEAKAVPIIIISWTTIEGNINFIPLSRDETSSREQLLVFWNDKVEWTNDSRVRCCMRRHGDKTKSISSIKKFTRPTIICCE